MSLDRRLCSIAIISLFIATIVVKGSSGLTVPPSPRTSDDFAKKLNQISTPDQLPETGSFLDGEAHGRYQRDLSDQARLEIYEADVETQTVSVRLTPLDPVLDGVDSYQVLISRKEEQYYHETFPVSQGLRCKLWDDALCFQNLTIASISEWDVPGSKIKVFGVKNGGKVAGKQWECNLQSDPDPKKDSSPPINLAITYPSPGVVKFQWKHPSFPNSEVPMFRVRFSAVKSSLVESGKVDDEAGQIHPPRRLRVEVVARNLIVSSTGRTVDNYLTTPSRIDFETPRFSSVGRNGTWIEFKVPGVFNLTANTWVNVTVEGPVNCTNDGSTADQTIIEGSSIVDEDKVHQNGPRTFRISEDGVRHPESTCYLQPGRSYVIKAEAKDEVTSVSAVPIESIEIAALPGGDGEASPNVTEEANLITPYEVGSI